MNEESQRRLLSGLAIALSLVLTRPIIRFIDDMIPERRGIREDLTEAALQGLVDRARQEQDLYRDVHLEGRQMGAPLLRRPLEEGPRGDRGVRYLR